MTEIVNQFSTPVIDSRDVADMIHKPHNDLLKDIRRFTGFLGEGGFSQSSFFIEGTYKNSQNKVQPCYLLTKMGCEMVANKMTGQKGVLFTAAYVQKFNDMENEPPQIVKDYLAMSTEDRAIAYFTKSKTLKIQAKQIEEYKPKVLFADSVADSHSTILIGALAKILKQNGVDIGQNRLFKWMRDNGYLIRQPGSNYNLPTQRSAELELFRIKENSIVHSNGYTEITKTVKVTGKGQQYFINKFLKAGVSDAIH